MSLRFLEKTHRQMRKPRKLRGPRRRCQKNREFYIKHGLKEDERQLFNESPLSPHSASCLGDHGHEVINPKSPVDDFAQVVRIRNMNDQLPKQGGKMRMKKAHIRLLCVLIVLACGAIATTFLFSNQGPEITAEQCERLQPGMTEEEVAEILGGPPGERWSSSSTWHGHQGSKISVLFGDEGKLFMAFFDPPPTVRERIEVGLRFLQPRKRLVIVETDGAPATRP